MESMMNELNRTKKIDRQMVSDYMEMVKVFENQIKTEEFNKTISTSTTPRNILDIRYWYILHILYIYIYSVYIIYIVYLYYYIYILLYIYIYILYI